ncbi:MAG: Nif3-like dinuclear metal center hexameric protein [Bacteroidales bacterium]|nr:Nif3-like dinuclear metal center hexameric protein [Bacteroidales bacterium]
MKNNDKTNAATLGDVVAFLDATFRPELQEDYDNSGFLVGDSATPFTGALVALDLTPAVVDEAESLGLNLIVTHHPFIFSGLKRITDRTESGRTLLKMVRHGIGAYAAHTNLDNLPWGVNGALCEKLGLVRCRILRPLAGNAEAGAGMVGELPSPLSADEFLQRVKDVLHQPTLRTTPHRAAQPVYRVALCGGSGAPFIADAIAAHADLYLTADLKYHDFQRSDGHLILADAGHYETEQFAKEIIYRAISEKFSNFASRISLQQESLVCYI